jgi:cytochrome P450
MKTGRRLFLSGIVAILAGTEALLARSQKQGPSTRLPQIPDASGTSPDDVPLPPRADPKVQLREDQKAIRRDVDHLLQMVKELKEQADKTPETDILSLSLVKKAEDIEKLARQIRDLIRAS